MLNEYKPWKKTGQTEIEYWKTQYLEARKNLEEIRKRDAENEKLIKDKERLDWLESRSYAFIHNSITAKGFIRFSRANNGKSYGLRKGIYDAISKDHLYDPTDDNKAIAELKHNKQCDCTDCIGDPNGPRGESGTNYA